VLIDFTSKPFSFHMNTRASWEAPPAGCTIAAIAAINTTSTSLRETV
jgi:hypothetical protein